MINLIPLLVMISIALANIHNNYSSLAAIANHKPLEKSVHITNNHKPKLKPYRYAHIPGEQQLVNMDVDQDSFDVC